MNGVIETGELRDEELPTQRRRTLRSAIRDAVESLAQYEFDWDGSDGLPIRDDVRQFIEYQFCSKANGANLDDELAFPSVQLLGDGTIEMDFVMTPLSLLLTFPCRDVISYARSSGAGSVCGVMKIDQDRIGESPYVRVNSLFAWLMGRESGL